MQVLTCVSTGKSVSLTNLLASSGEGEVWSTSVDGYLAKRYHNSTSERVNKLKVMVAHPPVDPNSQTNHVSFAWPKSLLKDNTGKCVGFLMPAISGSFDLIHIYNPFLRNRRQLAINWLFLHTTALNIASIIEAIHDNGYVLGDIKPQNILVNDRALPSIIDTDSFQVTNPTTGEVFRCLVGSEGYTPAELLNKDLATVHQTEVHDRFRLAVIIYQLLLGDHPFKGQWIEEGDSPEPTKLIEKGFWPYAQNSKIQPGRLTISLDVVHPEIKRCFLQCFNDGHTRPHLRPTAQEWRNVLAFVIEEQNLIECTKVEGHYYSKSYGKCNWCERKANLARDIFENARFTEKVTHPPKPGTKPQIFQNYQELLDRIKNEVNILNDLEIKERHFPTDRDKIQREIKKIEQKITERCEQDEVERRRQSMENSKIMKILQEEISKLQLEGIQVEIEIDELRGFEINSEIRSLLTESERRKSVLEQNINQLESQKTQSEKGTTVNENFISELRKLKSEETQLKTSRVEQNNYEVEVRKDIKKHREEIKKLWQELERLMNHATQHNLQLPPIPYDILLAIDEQRLRSSYS